MRPVTSHVASVPARPGYVAFEPHTASAARGCAPRVSGVWYARSACLVCRGAGLRVATPILAVCELAGEG